MNKKAVLLVALAGAAWWWYSNRKPQEYILTVDGEDSGIVKTAFGVGEELLSMIKTKPNLNMGLSLKGAAFIKSWEQFRKMPYYATKKEREKGILTVGYGQTYSDTNLELVEKYKNGISEAEASLLFANRVLEDEIKIANGVSVKLNQNQFDALVSLRYNLGGLGTAAPTLYAYLQAGNFEAAADAFMLYVKQGGEVLPGLYNRRAAEMKIFRFGIYTNNQ